MKRRIIALICFLLIFVMIASSCNSDETVETEPTEATEASETVKNDQTELCSSDNHDYVEVSRVDALALKDGEIKYQCSRCKKESVEKIEATKSLKILALGNSFTDDSTWHLWNICRDAGVKDLIVANLYVGNCNLDQHWDYIYNNKNPYIYRKTVSGTRVEKNNYKVIDALKDEDWDFIVLHQTSGSAGQIETFDNLDLIVRFMNSNKTNPNAKILWHMPWAYQSDSTHGEFGIGKAVSHDGGRTFDPDTDSMLGGPNSRFYVGRLSSGNILVVNHYQFHKRDHLTAMISRDEGQTFEGFLLLDERADVSYPDVKEHNGYLYVIYDRERGAHYRPDRDYSTAAREILLAKITEDDILAGKVISSGSFLKKIVSKLTPMA